MRQLEPLLQAEPACPLFELKGALDIQLHFIVQMVEGAIEGEVPPLGRGIIVRQEQRSVLLGTEVAGYHDDLDRFQRIGDAGAELVGIGIADAYDGGALVYILQCAPVRQLRLQVRVTLPEGKLIEQVDKRVEVLVGRPVDAAAIGQGYVMKLRQLDRYGKGRKQVEAVQGRGAGRVLAVPPEEQVAFGGGIFQAQAALQGPFAYRLFIIDIAALHRFFEAKGIGSAVVQTVCPRQTVEKAGFIGGGDGGVFDAGFKGALQQRSGVIQLEGFQLDADIVERVIEVLVYRTGLCIGVNIGLQVGVALVEMPIVGIDVEDVSLRVFKLVIGVEVVAAGALEIIVVLGVKVVLDERQPGRSDGRIGTGNASAKNKVGGHQQANRMLFVDVVIQPDPGAHPPAFIRIIGKAVESLAFLQAVGAVQVAGVTYKMVVAAIEVVGPPAVVEGKVCGS